MLHNIRPVCDSVLQAVKSELAKAEAQKEEAMKFAVAIGEYDSYVM